MMSLLQFLMVSIYLSVINTFQTFSSVRVTVALIRLNPVLGTVTALTVTSWHLGMAKEVVHADVTFVPGIPVLAVADGL